MAGPDPSETQPNAVIWPELWAAFEFHRRKVFDFLRRISTRSGQSVCVWGTGRTTDLELIPLVELFGTIDLVELDSSITEEALLQRGFDDHPQVRVHNGVDISGIDRDWQRFLDSPDEKTLQEVLSACEVATLDLPTYDVVVSTCLLSQLQRKAVECLEQSSLSTEKKQSLLPQVVASIRKRHLELMLGHTKSNGVALLVTDLTSSEALPEMLNPGADLKSLYLEKVMNGNHFHGMNPRAILHTAQGPSLAPKIDQVQVSLPWIWDAIKMKYLCVAFQFTRRAN